MGAKGNDFWKMRSSHGRKPIFESPEDLMKSAEEYFQWCIDNPLMESKPFQHMGEVQIVEIPKTRPMTQGGMCIFLDIIQETYITYRDREGFSEVTSKIDTIIRTNKFEGATVGMFNANIIARDLGLKDESKTEHSGKVALYEGVSDEELERRIKEFEANDE